MPIGERLRRRQGRPLVGNPLELSQVEVTVGGKHRHEGAFLAPYHDNLCLMMTGNILSHRSHPGGESFGVRLVASKLAGQQIAPRMRGLVNQLSATCRLVSARPECRACRLEELRRVAEQGARWAVENGFGSRSDLDHIEENGCIAGADTAQVSQRAWQRGREQLGTLGSGNHFLEVGYVSEIFDEEAAHILGLALNQVTVIIHCGGSRGFGYQICSDYLDVMDRAVKKYGILLPDRQLACAPVNSPEGQNYLGAMRCAINYAFANRQVIMHLARKAFEKALDISAADAGLRTVYEVAHNIAKFETHTVDGREMHVCVHRKGATRAFAPRCKEVPIEYQAVGQPVLIPGDMGRYSYVLTGTEKRCRRHSAAPATALGAR